MSDHEVRPLFNLETTARTLGMSVPTLRRLIRENPDFPVHKEGSKGFAYELDVAAVRRWLGENERKAAEAAEAENAQLEMYRPQYDSDESVDFGQGLNNAQRRAAIDAALAEIKLKQITGTLHEVQVTRDLVGPALVDLRKSVSDAVTLIAKKHNLPRDVRADLEREIAGRWNRQLDEIQSRFAGDSETGAQQVR